MFDSESEQDKLLTEAAASAKQAALLMESAIKSGSLRGTLLHASSIISELRSPSLWPKGYSDLFMQVCHHLEALLTFLSSADSHGRKMEELYDTVQHATNVLPRLYLMIAVSGVFLKAIATDACPELGDESIQAKRLHMCDIMDDITEFTKGVQHPVRGLFLRFYLHQSCKEYLPDDCEDDPAFERIFNCLFTNFFETTKLWVRLQSQNVGLQAESGTRLQKQRSELRVLVAAFLIRMSQAKGLSQRFFREQAAPRLLTHILSIKNVAAQHYLLECVIQVFNEALHVGALDVILGALDRVSNPGFASSAMISFLHRLTAFFDSSSEESQIDVNEFFRSVQKHVAQFVGTRLTAVEEAAKDIPIPTTAPPQSNIVESTFRATTVCRLLELLDAFMGLTLAAAARAERVHAAMVEEATRPPDTPGDDQSIVDMEPSPVIFPPPPPPSSPYQLIETVFSIAHSTAKRGMEAVPALVPFGNGIPQQPPDGNAVVRGGHRRSVGFGLSTGSRNPPPPPDAPDSPAGWMVTIASILERPLATGCQEVLSLPHMALLVDLLDAPHARQFASALFASLANEGHDRQLQDPDVVKRFLEYAKVVASPTSETTLDSETWSIDLNNVCRMLLKIEFENTDLEMNALSAFEHIANNSPVETFDILGPALVSHSLRLARRTMKREIEAIRAQEATPNVSPKKFLQFAHRVCMRLSDRNGDVALRYLLEASLVAEECDTLRRGAFAAICYEFLTQGILCLERNVTDSVGQFECVSLLASTLCSAIRCLDADAYDTLASKILQHATKLLVLGYQCRAILACAQLFWHPPERRQPERVNSCIRRAASVAAQALETSRSNWHLLVKCLQVAAAFTTCPEAADAELLEELREACAREAFNVEDSAENVAAVSVFEDTLHRMKGIREAAS